MTGLATLLFAVSILSVVLASAASVVLLRRTKTAERILAQKQLELAKNLKEIGRHREKLQSQTAKAKAIRVELTRDQEDLNRQREELASQYLEIRTNQCPALVEEKLEAGANLPATMGVEDSESLHLLHDEAVALNALLEVQEHLLSYLGADLSPRSKTYGDPTSVDSFYEPVRAYPTTPAARNVIHAQAKCSIAK